MKNKIRLINIERSKDGAILFKQRTEDSTVVELISTHIYYPQIINEISNVDTDIIAVDIHIPCNAITFIKELKKKITPAKILLTCDFVQPDLIFNCLGAGANSYVEKYCSKNKFEQAVKDCSENLIQLPLSIMGLLYAKNILHETDAALKNIFYLLSKGFLLNDVTRQTGLSEREIKRSIFLSLHQ